MNARKLSKLICLLAAVTLSLTFSGCVKARVAITVEPDGSGTLGVAVGMTQQAMSLAGTDGEGLMQRLSQELSAEEESGEDVAVRRWTEGEYEWIEATSSFADLADLNSRLGDTELFERFSLIHQQGLIKDQFMLDARLAPLLGDEERPQDLIVDPSGMFEFQISVRLPGDVTQTNGIFASDSNTMLWTVNNYEPLEMHAVSETWNWFNVGILAAIVLAGGTLVAVGAGIVFYRASGRKRESHLLASGTRTHLSAPHPSPKPTPKPREAAFTSDVTESPAASFGKASPGLAVPSNALSQINGRELLDQVNKHILSNTGAITEAPNEIRMSWPVAPGRLSKREIRIRVLDCRTLTINGVHVPAAQDDVKQALIAVLRQMKELS